MFYKLFVYLLSNKNAKRKNKFQKKIPVKTIQKLKLPNLYNQELNFYVFITETVL